MIVSASYRTDIPAFYGRWFQRRLTEGYCLVRNPYGGATSRVDLRPEAVDGFIFWTRNIAPFLPALADVSARRIPFVIHYTITGLPRVFERSVVAPEASVALFRRLSDRWGPKAVVWRYDPIVIAPGTGPDWHRDRFTGLASALAGATDEVVVSFMQPYRKTTRNLEKVGLPDWSDPPAEIKRDLLAELAAIAHGNGLRLTTCTQPALAGIAGVGPAACVDAGRLAEVAGRPISARPKGNRPGCLCAESRDIGEYDTCPHGCAYCYAVSDHARARRRYREHDPEQPFLFAPLPSPMAQPERKAL